MNYNYCYRISICITERRKKTVNVLIVNDVQYMKSAKIFKLKKNI